ASAPAKQACYPRYVESIHAKEDFQILIRLTEVVLNSRIPRSTFRFSVPAHTRTVRVDEQGREQPSSAEQRTSGSRAHHLDGALYAAVGGVQVKRGKRA